MNLLLLDILACPIDKSSPLKLYIFSVDTEIEEMERCLSNYKNKNIRLIQDEKIINIYEKDGKAYLSDKIVSDPVIIEKYLHYILSKLDLLEYLIDNTPSNLDKNFLTILRSEVRDKVKNVFLKTEHINIEELLPYLYLINKILIDLRIDVGIFICQKCGRWFPIYDGIPHLLPDNQRDEKEERNRLGEFNEKLNRILSKEH